MKPNWTHAFKSKNDKYEVVKSQILTLGGFGFATAEALSTCKSSNNAGYLNSLSRLVILKYKKDGRIVPFIMTVVGDKEYLEKKKFAMKGETYLKRDKDLSGFVFYHSTEGKFVNGWQYKDGKVVGKIVINDDNTQSFNLKSAYYLFYSYITVCNPTTWTSLDGPIGVKIIYSANCTTTYTVNYTYTPYNGTETVTSWIQAEEGGGGYDPASAEPCNCVNICPVCGGCVDLHLKSVPIPGDGTTTTTTTDPCTYCTCPALPEIKDALLANYPCASSVLQSFTNFNTFISNTLQSTFGVSQTYNVTFIGAILAATVDGTRTGSAGGSLKGIENIDLVISINDFVLKNSTKEYIAVTYAHETLHALIDYYNATDPQKGKELFPMFYEMVGFEPGQHLTIAMKYVDKMVEVIKMINPNMPTSDATFLSWVGLQGTRAYDQKRSDYDSVCGSGAWDRDIYMIQERERNGSSTAHGTKCNP